ncbi:pyocin knob domain-containing protein [Providencia rettgeri]|uniref:pyocin knob domain-containing protein n=1 Tax=Providencia rettgeri TaxID=587 RepID=UPI0025736957|nr:pyocin knob domain-containing protein [Providencia rettgeri]MDL9982991.1 pyocin knob domain-containing protein [Providencia rettgeri]
MIYEIGTISTKANDPKITGKNTLWKNSVTKVSVGQIILIQSGNTIYQNSIRSVESDTQMTLSFPVTVALTDVKYVISITMIGSVSDGVNKATAMVTESYQLMMILNRLMTESGVIKVVLPDGTEMQLRTEKERDRLLNGKFDKAGGQFNVDGEGVALRNISEARGLTLGFRDKGNELRGYVGFPDGSNKLSLTNHGTGKMLSLLGDGRLTYDGNEILKVGDYGLGVVNGMQIPNYDYNDIQTNGFYGGTGSIEAKNPPPQTTGGNPVYGAVIMVSRSSNEAFLIAAHRSEIVYRYKSSGVWSDSYLRFYTTANTTKDSNGNLKAASPVVKLFADNIELNDESEGVEMEHLGIGHYLIKGVVGFNADGAWGINNGFVIPQDHNGKNMVLIDYEVRPDGDIEVFVFHQQNADMPERFQNKRIKHFDEEGVPVYFENYEPCDVPESRWIDMRVEMPPNSLYNQKQAEAERLAKLEAERLAQEEAKRAAEEAERAEQEAAEQVEQQ